MSNNAKPLPFKTVINKRPVICNSNLNEFEIIKKQSSFIDYFAICRQTSKLFIQYNNGKCFVFSDVPVETLEAATTTASIGTFFHARIKEKFPTEEVADNCIKFDDNEEHDDDDLEDDDNFDIDL